jgi:hypothetical protein
MNKNDRFNYDRRMSYPEDKISGMDIPWDSTLVSDDGAHYHCWIPYGLSDEDQKNLLERFKRAVRNHGDAVYFSYDYLPDPVDCECEEPVSVVNNVCGKCLMPLPKENEDWIHDPEMGARG